MSSATRCWPSIGQGHKRLILVCGEHPDYAPSSWLECVERIYNDHEGPGEIRRVNINAAPLDRGRLPPRSRPPASAPTRSSRRPITTPPTPPCTRAEPRATTSGAYGMDRALEAGSDDIGIGALSASTTGASRPSA